MDKLFRHYSIGHFINEPENPTGFEILQFGEMDEPEVDDVHKHTFYEIIWTDGGSSRQVIDYNEYEVQPRSLFFISPGQVHSFEEWKPLSGGSILFTGEFFLLGQQDHNRLFELTFLDNFHSNPCLSLDVQGFEEIKNSITLLIKEYKRPDRNYKILQSLLHVILEQAQRHVNIKNPVASAKSSVVLYKRFRQLVEQNFTKNETPAFYADRLNITQHHLNRTCKAVAGITSSEVLRSRSMLEAKRLLTFSGMSVSEIASTLHYFDSSYFSKLFRTETGMSPLAFKAVMSEKYRIK